MVVVVGKCIRYIRNYLVNEVKLHRLKAKTDFYEG